MCRDACNPSFPFSFILFVTYLILLSLYSLFLLYPTSHTIAFVSYSRTGSRNYLCLRTSSWLLREHPEVNLPISAELRQRSSLLSSRNSMSMPPSTLLVCCDLRCHPRIVNDPKNDELIKWSDSGDSFYGQRSCTHHTLRVIN